jgi:hypothetical protein
VVRVNEGRRPDIPFSEESPDVGGHPLEPTDMPTDQLENLVARCADEENKDATEVVITVCGTEEAGSR